MLNRITFPKSLSWTSTSCRLKVHIKKHQDRRCKRSVRQAKARKARAQQENINPQHRYSQILNSGVLLSYCHNWPPRVSLTAHCFRVCSLLLSMLSCVSFSTGLSLVWECSLPEECIPDDVQSAVAIYSSHFEFGAFRMTHMTEFCWAWSSTSSSQVASGVLQACICFFLIYLRIARRHGKWHWARFQDARYAGVHPMEEHVSPQTVSTMLGQLSVLAARPYRTLLRMKGHGEHSLNPLGVDSKRYNTHHPSVCMQLLSSNSGQISLLLNLNNLESQSQMSISKEVSIFFKAPSVYGMQSLCAMILPGYLLIAKLQCSPMELMEIPNEAQQQAEQQIERSPLESLQLSMFGMRLDENFCVSPSPSLYTTEVDVSCFLELILSHYHNPHSFLKQHSFAIYLDHMNFWIGKYLWHNKKSCHSDSQYMSWMLIAMNSLTLSSQQGICLRARALEALLLPKPHCVCPVGKYSCAIIVKHHRYQSLSRFWILQEEICCNGVRKSVSATWPGCRSLRIRGSKVWNASSTHWHFKLDVLGTVRLTKLADKDSQQ